LGEWSTAAGIVEEGFDNAGDLGGTLWSIKRPELGSTLAMVSVSFENVPVSLSLGANDMPHGIKVGPNRSNRL
jgi:hypothetical protein